ncbi:MAG: class I adenylate-forming enzyme family protein [Cyclobacteriaceae bacterium]
MHADFPKILNKSIFDGFNYNYIFESKGDYFGLLVEKRGFSVIPVVNNLIFNNESDFSADLTINDKLPKLREKLSKIEEYESFLSHKRRKSIYDPYACFQPFNEATKSLYPMLEKMRTSIKPKSTILNLWDRSGWLTSVLLGLFPECHIVTTWEGNKDVLGYLGYSYWFGNNPRVNILFTDLEKPLPIKTAAIDMVVGFDVLHRYDQHTLLNELVRVTATAAPLVFPHVHLSNSEPEPYFDRGCRQLHGRTYANGLDRYSQQGEYESYVLSEPHLFKLNQNIAENTLKLETNPNTSDYNAMVALLPKSWKSKALTPLHIDFKAAPFGHHILLNHLLRFDFGNQLVFLEKEHLAGMVGYMMERHPTYLQYIEKVDKYDLTALEVKLLYLSEQGWNVGELCDELDLKQVYDAMNRLLSFGIIEVLPLQDSGFRLQKYLSSQTFIDERREQTLEALWKKKVARFSSSVYIESLQDQTEITYTDADEVVKLISTTLEKRGISNKASVMVVGSLHPEGVLLFWACMKMGVVFVPLSGKHPAAVLSQMIKETDPVLIFSTVEAIQTCQLSGESNIIAFDDEEGASTNQYFSDWLEDDSDILSENTQISADDLAVILYTSGSTGQPKGVKLTQGNLYRSGMTVADHFEWTGSDRYFGLGGLDTMSGLRNTAISPVYYGSTLVIPDSSKGSSFLQLASQVVSNQATIIAANPAFLGLCVQFRHKLSIRLSKLRLVMCTGNSLSLGLRSTFKEVFGLNIYNYYGHTETSGICTAESIKNSPNSSVSTIGQPIEAIIQIVDNNKMIVKSGETGQIRVYSQNLMMGYHECEERPIIDGWYYTGDVGRCLVDGCIELVGRIRDIIKRPNEEIVYVNHVAALAQGQDNVEEAVSHVTTIGGKDKFTLFITIDDMASQSTIIPALKSLIKDQLGSSWVPDQLIILAEMPYNDHGKIEKQKLINVLQERN